MPIQALYQQKYNRQPSLSEILSPALWYDASDSSTVTLSGSTVTAWANKGATSGYNLSLYSGAPTYTATQNGLNVMTYDGTDRMITTQLNSVTHIFVASAWSAAGAVSTNYNGFLSSGGYDWHGPASTALVASRYGAAWVISQPTQSTSQLDGSNFVNVSNSKWTTFSVYSINLQNGYTGGFNGTGYGNGSSRVFLGDYGEIIVYQTDYLTTDQINTITGYLAHKWGSQSLLPSEHPYRAESPFFQVDSYPLKFSAKGPTPTIVTKTKISTNRIVTDGLVLNLDAGYRASYNGTGDTWFDVSGNGNNGTLVNGVQYGVPGISTVTDAYSVTVNVNSGTANFTNLPYDSANRSDFSRIFDGSDSDYYTGSTQNFDVTVTFTNPIEYTSRTVSIYHATLNAIDIITTGGTVTASTGGSSTAEFTYTNLLPEGETITGMRFYTLSTNSNDMVIYIKIDGEILNLFPFNSQYSPVSYFDFDGTNDCVDVTNNANLYPGTGDFTAEVWCLGTASSGYRYLLSNYGNSGSDFYGWGIFTGASSSGISAFMQSGSGATGVTISNTSVNLNDVNWHHVVFVRSGNAIRLYHNGEQIESDGDVTGYNVTSSEAKFRIGKVRNASDPDGGFYFWNGNISNVRIYKGKGLTAAEVQKNFNLLKGRYGL